LYFVIVISCVTFSIKVMSNHHAAFRSDSLSTNEERCYIYYRPDTVPQYYSFILQPCLALLQTRYSTTILQLYTTALPGSTTDQIQYYNTTALYYSPARLFYRPDTVLQYYSFIQQPCPSLLQTRYSTAILQLYTTAQTQYYNTTAQLQYIIAPLYSTVL
jgi:hypothetical protein